MRWCLRRRPALGQPPRQQRVAHRLGHLVQHLQRPAQRLVVGEIQDQPVEDIVLGEVAGEIANAERGAHAAVALLEQPHQRHQVAADQALDRVTLSSTARRR